MSRTGAAEPQASRLLQRIKDSAGDALGDALGEPTPMTKCLNQRFRSYRSSLLDSRLHPAPTVAIKAKQLAADARAMADGDLMSEYTAAGSSAEAADEGAMLRPPPALRTPGHPIAHATHH